MLREPARPAMQTAIDPDPVLPDPLILAGTLAARMCHDLAGSLGVLTGTLELATEDGDAEALRLSMALAQDVTARLRLLRGAWGSMTDLPDWESLVAGLPGAEKLRIDMTGLDVAENASRQLVLSLLLVAAAALPRGGRIILRGDEAEFRIEIEGQRAAWPDLLAACLTDDAALHQACDSPRHLAMALACLLARSQNRHISIDGATSLAVRV